MKGYRGGPGMHEASAESAGLPFHLIADAGNRMALINVNPSRSTAR